MYWPSGAQRGSVSMPADVAMRFTPLPSALTTYSCDEPSLVSTTASCLPSGDQAGAEFEPLKLAATWRRPLARSCTYTTGFFASKET